MKCLSLWLVLGMVSCAYAELEVYVSADAAADGDGSRPKPYQTLTQARNGIRTLRKDLAVNTAGTADGMAKPVDVAGFANLSGTKDNPIDLGFDNATAPDSSSRWQAWLQKEIPSFETIPFDRIGLYKDEYRHTLPAR